MKINEADIEFDVLDADTMEKYETALTFLEKRMDEEKDKEHTKVSDAIRSQCHIIFDFFNMIFGEGADRKIFGGKTNLKICYEAVETINAEAQRQRIQFEQLIEKYSPKRLER